MTRIIFEDLPSTNTPRNAENLNKLNNVVISSTEPTTGEEVWIDDTNKKIYTKNDNGNYEKFYDEEEVNKVNYSTEEQVIGTWINGKPLYKKVIEFGSLPNASSKEMIIDNLYVDTLVSMQGIAHNPTSLYFMPLPLAHGNSANVINLWSTKISSESPNFKIGIETYSDRSGYTKTYIILEYTKTTD